jgi:hypothetical protein
MASILFGATSLFCFARSYKYAQLSMVSHLATVIDGRPGIKMAQLSPYESVMGYHDGNDFVKLWSHTYTHDRDGDGAFETNAKFYLTVGGVAFVFAGVLRD